MTTIAKCPTCNNEVVWSKISPYRPFCRKRCQLIDFYGWANEKQCVLAGRTSTVDNKI